MTPSNKFKLNKALSGSENEIHEIIDIAQSETKMKSYPTYPNHAAKPKRLVRGKWLVSFKEKRAKLFYALLAGFIIMVGAGVGIIYWALSPKNQSSSSSLASNSANNFHVIEVNLFGTGVAGSQDGPSSNASFHSPSGVTADNEGNIYIADAGNNVIRRINATGFVSTLAGSAIQPASFQNGIGSDARFNAPNGIAYDLSVNMIFIVDSNNSLVRQMTLDGLVSTIAGNLAPRSDSKSNDGQSTNATFNSPYAIAVDSRQNLYISDTGNNLVRQINASRYVSTFGGNSRHSKRASVIFTYTLSVPLGIAVDSLGCIFVVDSGNLKIIKFCHSQSDSSYSTFKTVMNLNSSSNPAIAVDNSGSLWVSRSDSSDLQVVHNDDTVITVTAPANTPIKPYTFLAFKPNGDLVSSISSMNLIVLFSFASSVV